MRSSQLVRRPRQIYIGPAARDYTAIESRKKKDGIKPTEEAATVAHLYSKRHGLADYAEKRQSKL
jgi:hypothetical protein